MSLKSKNSQHGESNGSNDLPQLGDSFNSDPIEDNEQEEEKLDKVEEL